MSLLMTTFTTLIDGYKAAIAKAMTCFFRSQFYFQIHDSFFLGGGGYDEISDFFLL
jgi:hypothetical protein